MSPLLFSVVSAVAFIAVLRGYFLLMMMSDPYTPDREGIGLFIIASLGLAVFWPITGTILLAYVLFRDIVAGGDIENWARSLKEARK